MTESINEFLKYIKPYKKYGKWIDLKIEHIIRVKDLYKEIGKSLKIPKKDIKSI